MGGAERAHEEGTGGAAVKMLASLWLGTRGAAGRGCARERFRTARAQRQLLRCLSREHPCKPPPYRSVHDPFKTASGVRNSGPWDPWLPVAETSRLFAQRACSARCAPWGLEGRQEEGM